MSQHETDTGKKKREKGTEANSGETGFIADRHCRKGQRVRRGCRIPVSVISDFVRVYAAGLHPSEYDGLPSTLMPEAEILISF